MPGTCTIDGAKSLIQIFSGRIATLSRSPSADPVWPGTGTASSGATRTAPPAYVPCIRLLVPMKPAAKTEVGFS